jgi:hypothetical protein
MGGLACKEVIDGGNNNGMAEQLIGALRSMQVFTDNVAKTIADLEEYMTDEEKKAAIKWAYTLCDFGDKKILPFAEEVKEFIKKFSTFYVEVAKNHQYDEHEYVSGQISESE